jgi:hypothetical protein
VETVHDNIPTKRIQVYSDLGLTRVEGAKLCRFLGFGVRFPLRKEQVRELRRICELFNQWKGCGHGVDNFIKFLEESDSAATNAATTRSA